MYDVTNSNRESRRSGKEAEEWETNGYQG